MKRSAIFKKNSMASKILLTSLVLVLLEGVVFLAMLFGGDLQSKIKDSAFQTFNDKIESRKNTLENVLTSKVYKNELYDDILEECNALRASSQSVHEMKITPTIANSLKLLLHNTSSSGAFIIFDSDDEIYNGLSIRDMEPNNVSINDGDLLAEFGSSDLIKEIGLTMDYQWKSTLTMNSQNELYDFYYSPFEIANKYPNSKPLELAYWSKPYQMNKDDDMFISFSFPLLDENHKPYGVIGIQFSLDYIKSLLPYDEINYGEGAYVLSYQKNAEDPFTSLLVSGPMYNDLTSQYTLVEQDQDRNIYSLKEPDKEKTDVSIHYLNLYNHNSPFQAETWSLVGLVPERILLSALQDIVRSLIISVIVTVFVGIMGTFIITLYFSKPFVKLLRSLNEADINKPLQLPKVDIDELDQLSNVVENMSNSIFESSSRLSKIILLMKLPLGAIEIDKHSNKVFFTEKIADLMNFSDTLRNKSYITTEDFNEEVKRFSSDIIAVEKEESESEELSDVYLVEKFKEKKGTMWIRFSILIRESTTLVTVNDVTREILEKQKLEYERNYDILTNLLNRRAFHEEFDNIITHRDLRCSALLLWDLDNLKFINDTYGHDFGDLYIKEASNVFLTLNPKHAIASRMAGDEFLVFLYGMESREQLLILAKDIHHAMMAQELDLLDHEKIRIRSSAGLAWYPDDGKDYDELLKHADYAMYSAKQNLKGSMEIFDYQSYKTNYLLFETLEDFNKIIDEKLYRFAFQPIVDAANGEIFGYEALIRPQGNTIKSPQDLINIARSQSKLQIIEKISFVGALEEYSKQKKAFKDARLFVNSIPKISWGEKIISDVEKTYASILHNLVIEIIESDHITSDNLKNKRDTVERWHAALALDDFGSGYNNETAILSIHPQYLKIDRELISNIDIDERKQMIVQNLIQYAKAQDIKTIGEGVETQGELAFLVRSGIDYLQGFYLAKPNFKALDIKAALKKEIITLAKEKPLYKQ